MLQLHAAMFFTHSKHLLSLFRITETILEKRTADWQAALAEAEFLRQLIARQERATCYNNAQGQLDSELQYYKQQYELRIQLARFEVEYQQVTVQCKPLLAFADDCMH